MEQEHNAMQPECNEVQWGCTRLASLPPSLHASPDTTAVCAMGTGGWSVVNSEASQEKGPGAPCPPPQDFA